MQNQLLGIDIGTSACKVAVFDEKGKVLAGSNKPYRVYYPKDGWVEQDPNEWWGAICEGIREVLSAEGVLAHCIRGIGIDGQSWSVIPVNKAGEVLCRTPIWMDTRARDICRRIKEQVGEEAIFQVAGNDFLPSYCTPKMIWLKEERNDIYRQTYRFLQSNSYIAYKLTGVMSQDYSQGYGIHFFHMSTLTYDTTLAKELGLSADMLPDLYPCDAIIGKVTTEAARLTGLPEGLPVVAGGLDAACGALGAGVYQTGQTQEQGGQAGGMSICTDQVLAHKKLILGTHVVPGQWLLQGGTVGGGGTLKWFQRELGTGNSFDELTAEAANIPAGAEGVIFLPYMAGERSPIWDPDAKGVFYGLSYDKTRGHMIRALLEGVAYSLEDNIQTAEETGIEIGILNAIGGASNSVLWTQIKADVTGRTIQVPMSDTATTLGAALLAGVGCGMYQDYRNAVEQTIVITRYHEPNWERHKIYKHYMQLYKELYTDLRETFSRYK
jgi:xylulokinase